MTELTARVARQAVLTAFAVFLSCLVAAAADGSQTLRGVALVIGNGGYEHLPKLANPENDARAIEALLADLGFETELSSDRDARRLARDLEYFVEDAEGADVAVIYYAGHGIEAGGENWLVPVDADIGALDAAADQLVPVSDIISRLRAAVPVTIVMLDACRDNPFPEGAALKASPDGAPVAISAGGLALGGARGATTLTATGSGDEIDQSLGIVIGFAAEPGRTALDGQPGENSPYTSAILRHLGAMTGTDFGTVMRMVAEEVWLKTNGRQRPWVNESLRRLLYFGEAPAVPEGPQGDLVNERRRLLITIAELPEFGRARVERIAQQNGVPMDALFGLLNAMGAEAPGDPARLEEVLKQESLRIRKILEDRAALESGDPEVARLSALADQAESEGLIESARKLRELAKQRDAEFQATVVDQAEAQVKAQRIASAEVFARSAETYQLAFEPGLAAADFGAAFERVERWDRALAWRYRFEQMSALTSYGDLRGDNEALERAIEIGEDAAAIATELNDRAKWSLTKNEIGHALRKLGERESTSEHLLQAVAVFSEAAQYRPRDTSPKEWAETQADRGRALARIGQREPGLERLFEAIAAYRSALEVYPREEDPVEWANIQLALGGALGILGDREAGVGSFEGAVVALNAAQEAIDPAQQPVLISMITDNLAAVYAMMAERSGDIAMMRKAEETTRQSLALTPREQFPQDWANASHNLGVMTRLLGQQTGDDRYLLESVRHIRAALEEWTRDVSPVDWAQAKASLGITLTLLAGNKGDADIYQQAVDELQASLEVRQRDIDPLAWADTLNSLALTLKGYGYLSRDLKTLRLSARMYQTVLEEWTRDRVPLQWAKTQHNLGVVATIIGDNGGDDQALLAAADAFSAALSVRSPELTPADWGHSKARLGIARAIYALRTGDRELMRQGHDDVETAIQLFAERGMDDQSGGYRQSLQSIDRALADLAAEE
ncbi:MAG: caspase family protein [Brucellaceae bacterium]|nr:caspase family protein [Brucellaceae bacterium]